MKTLIVEDDFTSRLLLAEILKHYGTVHIAVNGSEALTAVKLATDAGEPYELICLDIMMPEMDGYHALTAIRALEEEHGGGPRRKGAKIVMTTALKDSRSVIQSFRGQCDAYLTKPLEKARLLDQLRDFGLI
jgi:two-component system, chemotaxis family, chemotaxis protein CheY